MLLAQLRRSTAMDGGGSAQNRVRKANSQLKNVHGCTFVDHPLKKLFIPMNVLSAIKIYQGFRLKFYSHSAECHLLYHFLCLQSISFSHDF